MFTVTREIDFCYGHRVLDPTSPCRHLHGHNGRAVISLESSKLDERGMVLDFTDIKRVVASWIDRELDHRMLLQQSDPAVELLERLGEPMHLMQQPPTPEHIANEIFLYTRSQGFPIVSCQLFEPSESRPSSADAPS